MELVVKGFGCASIPSRPLPQKVTPHPKCVWRLSKTTTPTRTRLADYPKWQEMGVACIGQGRCVSESGWFNGDDRLIASYSVPSSPGSDSDLYPNVSPLSTSVFSPMTSHTGMDCHGLAGPGHTQKLGVANIIPDFSGFHSSESHGGRLHPAVEPSSSRNHTSAMLLPSSFIPQLQVS
jgi:hypothetical protein